MSTRPTESMYDDGEYLRNNPDWHTEDSAWKAQHVASLLTDNGVEPKSIVDIGCGAGQVLTNLRARFPDARMVGWDNSDDVVGVWDAAGNEIDLRHGDFRSDEHRYDVALMLDVFEHVPDYMGMLRDASTLADRFVFHIPLEMNLSSVLRKRYLYTREVIGHLHYFSAESAAAVLRDCGYEIVDSRLTNGARELPSAQRPITHVANVVRSGLERLGKARASLILGGYSLLVLATPAA